jgi:hypothetical protein
LRTFNLTGTSIKLRHDLITRLYRFQIQQNASEEEDGNQLGKKNATKALYSKGHHPGLRSP